MPVIISDIQLNRLRDNLPLFRKIIGYSAEKLGSFIGMKRQQISSLETGRTKLTQVHYRAITQIINESISEKLEDNDINIALFVILVLLGANEEIIDDNEYLIWIDILSNFSKIKDVGNPDNQIKLLNGFAIAAKNLKKGDVVPSLGTLERIIEIFKSSIHSLNNMIYEE